jgi:N-acetylglucosaminyl-diphospho-decaprenol L-rhamnosyltransferase
VTVVVIPFYSGHRWIDRCVESVLNTSSFQVLIIDNSPTPAPYFTSGRVRIIRTKNAIGFGRACNLGYYHAIDMGADYVVFLNQDSFVLDGALDALVEPLKSRQAAISTPIICSYDNPDKIDSFYMRMYVYPLTSLVSDLLTFSELKNYYQVTNSMSGACLAVCCSDEKIFGFDPAISMYGEDLDLFWRYQRLGKKVVIVPSARVAHCHSHATATVGRLRGIKAKIHRHTPYSLYNRSDLSLFRFLFNQYSSALFHFNFALLFSYLLTDLSLPYRLFLARTRTNETLLHRVVNQVYLDARE